MRFSTAIDPPQGEQARGRGPSDSPGRALYFHTDLFRHFNVENGRIALAKNDAGVAEVSLPVLPEGKFEHPWYGTLEWTAGVFRDMIRNFNAGVSTVPFLNLDHAGLGFFGDGGAPAAGWFTELFHDEQAGMLMARNELTNLGEESIGSRQYRYTSAEVWDKFSNSRGETFANYCSGLALTNRPFHDTMPGAFGQPEPAICLSNKGPYTLWAPGARPSPEAMQGLSIPGFQGNSFYQIPFSSQLPAGSVVSHSVVVGGSPAREEQTMAPKPEEKNGADPAAADPAALSGAAAAADDGVIVTPEPVEDPAAVLPLELDAAGEPIVLDTGAGSGEEGDDQPVTLSARELRELQALAQQGAQANTLLLEAAAEQKVARFVASGAIPRKKEKLALKWAMTDPENFAAYFTDLPPCIPLQRVGFAGDGLPGGPAATGGEGQDGGAAGATFLARVHALRAEHPAMSASEAMEAVAAEHPELFVEHRRSVRGHSSKNGAARS